MDGERFNMDEKKENIISDGMKSLMEFIDEDANPPVQQKPYWLCGKCACSA